MIVQQPHPWDVSPPEARAIQEQYRERVRLEDRVHLEDISVVAGVDNAYLRGEPGTAHAVVVTLRFPAMEMIETVFGSAPVTFPYVPGLLTFREAPAVLQAFERLSVVPDVVLFDGQGIAHPRRFGLASHLGVVLDLPSIGCAKTRLVGRYEEPDDVFGAVTPIMDRGEQIGEAVRTRLGHAPLLVSPGTGVTIDTAARIVLACCRDNRFMPEPTRLAHNAVTARAKADRNAQGLER